MNSKILYGLMLFLGLVVLALINQFWINFIIFACLFYFAFNEAKELFKAKTACVWVLFVAFVLVSFTSKALEIGSLMFILMFFYKIYKEQDLSELKIYLYPCIPLLALYGLYLNHGIFALFWLIITVAASDTFAYFIGKKFGKTKLSKISPNKTLQGALAGLAFGTLFGFCFAIFEYSFFVSLFCSFFGSLLAIIGDLIESYFKRQAQVKDSSNLIPGHGGILDRLDSALIACFVWIAFL